jgi:hypothetical protein
MQLHRFANLATTQPESGTATAVAEPVGFVTCPAVLLQGATPERLAFIQYVYQLALEQARASRKPRLLDLLYHPSAN